MKILLRIAAAAVVIAAVVGVAGAGLGTASSTPIGELPDGPVTTVQTKPGLFVAVALAQPKKSSGLVWRVARPYDSDVVRQVSEAEVGRAVVLVFKVVGRGDTSLVFALTRGESSPNALRAATQRIRSH
jgi:hypothetical protein